MNYVDYNFDWLVKRIERQTKDELFKHMKDRYLQLPVATRKAIEDFLNDFDYWGKLDSNTGEFEEIWNKAATFHLHLEDLKRLYRHLKDYRSKKLLFGILYNWYDYDFGTLKELMDNTYCHYFDLDLIQCKDEVFVDVGAYIGDTTLDFIHSFGDKCYQKIYCYEITEETFHSLVNNLKKYPNIDCRRKAISNRNETLHMTSNLVSSSANTLSKEGTEIEAVSLDNDITDKITMIKMDIEGAETKAIKGAKKHIREDHPKLLISVYHNHEDIWRIPKLIEEICPGYQFYLRFYGSYLFPTEIVLIGIYEK